MRVPSLRGRSPKQSQMFCSVLVKRVYEHRTHAMPGGFTNKYNCTKLVWYKTFNRIEKAIAEEKRIKGGSRKQKVALINDFNPEWKDLWNDINE